MNDCPAEAPWNREAERKEERRGEERREKQEQSVILKYSSNPSAPQPVVPGCAVTLTSFCLCTVRFFRA